MEKETLKSHILFQASWSSHHKIRKSTYNRYITQKPLNHMGRHVWFTALKSLFLRLAFILFSYSSKISSRVDENLIGIHFYPPFSPVIDRWPRNQIQKSGKRQDLFYFKQSSLFSPLFIMVFRCAGIHYFNHIKYFF